MRYDSAPFFFRGPTEGPALPPGRYVMVFHLDGTTYRFPLVKLADPQSHTTPAEYQAAFEAQRRAYNLVGRIDTMLNSLHDTRATLVGDKAALKPADTATAAKVQAAIDAIDAQVATLTSSPQSFEDFIQKPGQLREDALNLTGDEPLAQASLTLYVRLERTYASRATAYDAWTILALRRQRHAESGKPKAGRDPATCRHAQSSYLTAVLVLGLVLVLTLKLFFFGVAAQSMRPSTTRQT